jgi:hypothetical protein
MDEKIQGYKICALGIIGLDPDISLLNLSFFQDAWHATTYRYPELLLTFAGCPIRKYRVLVADYQQIFACRHYIYIN